jgi:hypothetical protein
MDYLHPTARKTIDIEIVHLESPTVEPAWREKALVKRAQSLSCLVAEAAEGVQPRSASGSMTTCAAHALEHQADVLLAIGRI